MSGDWEDRNGGRIKAALQALRFSAVFMAIMTLLYALLLLLLGRDLW